MHASGTTTPSNGDTETLVASSPTSEEGPEDVKSVVSVEKVKQRRSSFGCATLAPPSTPPASGAPDTTKPVGGSEHIEQGRVKWNVYTQYIRAASARGVLRRSSFALLYSRR